MRYWAALPRRRANAWGPWLLSWLLRRVHPHAGSGIFHGLLSSVSLSLFFFLFPDGRFVPRWTRWLAVVAIVWDILLTFFPDSPFSMESGKPLRPAGFVMLILFVSTGLFAQIYRYRRVSSMVQRQQTKWVVFGVVAAWFVAIGLLFPFFFYPSLGQPGSLYKLISTMPIT